MCVFNRVNMCIIGIPNMRVHQEMSTCMYIYIHNKEHCHLTQQRWITWICSPAKATWGFDQLKPMVSQEDSIELSSIKLITCGASRMYRASRLTKIPKAPRAGFQGVFQLRNALSHWIHTEVQTLGTRLHDPILVFYIAFLAKSERWSCKSLMFAGRIRKKNGCFHQDNILQSPFPSISCCWNLCILLVWFTIQYPSLETNSNGIYNE